MRLQSGISSYGSHLIVRDIESGINGHNSASGMYNMAYRFVRDDYKLVRDGYNGTHMPSLSPHIIDFSLFYAIYGSQKGG